MKRQNYSEGLETYTKKFGPYYRTKENVFASDVTEVTSEFILHTATSKIEIIAEFPIDFIESTNEN